MMYISRTIDEYTFRCNRRNSRNRGLRFYAYSKNFLLSHQLSFGTYKWRPHFPEMYEAKSV
jgi:hypothetical protein